MLPLPTRAQVESLKADLYTRSGIHEYWLADPETRTLVIRALDEGRWIPTGAPGRPDLTLGVAALFVDLG